MSDVVALSLAGLNAPGPRAAPLGVAPDLRWIEIDLLRVDLDYQRRLGAHSRRAIDRIAAGFDWARFGAVVVAPAGDAFAIIDGQHRTTAAKLIGLSAVPCILVSADKAAQARAFVAANRDRIRPHALQVHSAAVAAGDRQALEIERACAEAEVRLQRSPESNDKLGQTRTNSAGAIGVAIDRFGFAPTRDALRALSRHPHGFSGILSRDWILPAAELFAAGQAYLLDGRDLAGIDEGARDKAIKHGGRRQAWVLNLLRGAVRPAHGEGLAPPLDKLGVRADFRPSTSSGSGPTADCRLPTANCRLPTADAPRPQLRPGVKIIDRRPAGDLTAIAMGDPPPGRSALAQRQAGNSGGSR